MATSSSILATTASEKPRRKRVLDDKACEVCNDKSTGKHYGVFVCDGCSGFFKRSVRRSIPWVCRSNGNCVVDKASRTECRACRFNKCLVVNMNPEGVQSPRGARVSHDRKNTTSDSDSTNSTNTSPHARELHRYEKELESETRSVFSNEIQPSGNTKRSSPVPSPTPLSMVGSLNVGLTTRNISPVMVKIEADRRDTDSGDDEPKNSDTTTTMNDYIRRANIDPAVVVMQPSNIRSSNKIISYGGRHVETYPQTLPSTPIRPMLLPEQPAYSGYACTTARFASTSVPRLTPSNLRGTPRNTPATSLTLPYTSNESLYSMAVRLLSSAVKFAKNIPSFKLLAFRDQVILLEESWKDLFIVDAAFWSFPMEVSFILSPVGAKKDTNTGLVLSLRALQELVARVQALGMDETECAHLKTVVIFKPDIKGLKDSQQVEQFQDEAQVKFAEYIRSKKDHNPARFGRLLLTLLAFERVSQDVIEKLFFQTQSDKISVEYILHDLFKNT